MSLIYLDNGATSFPKAPGVAEAVRDNLLTCGTSGRASYEEALEGSRILYGCRRNLAELFSVKDSSRIVLNSGTTESLNTILKGFLKKGMKVLTSSCEHNSVMRPLRRLEREGIITVERFSSLPDGQADRNSFAACTARRPDLIVLSHSSNVSGAVYPLKEMAEIARSAGIPLCVDGAQSAGHDEIDLTALGVDFYCFSGHKGLLGPAGTGGFYIREVMEINPLTEGGTGSLSEEEEQPDFIPDRYESGTRNLPGYAGLAASTAFILKTGAENIGIHEKELAAAMIEGLTSIKGIKVVGPEDMEVRNSVVSFYHERVDVSDLAEALDEAEIAQRMGLHCAPSTHRTLGTFDRGGTIRFSPGYFNCMEDIEKAVETVKDIVHGY